MRPNACRATATGPGSAFPELVGNADNATHDGNTPSNSRRPCQPRPGGRPGPTQCMTFIPAALATDLTEPVLPQNPPRLVSLLLADQRTPRRDHRHVRLHARRASAAAAHPTRHRLPSPPATSPAAPPTPPPPHPLHRGSRRQRSPPPPSSTPHAPSSACSGGSGAMTRPAAPSGVPVPPRQPAPPGVPAPPAASSDALAVTAASV